MANLQTMTQNELNAFIGIDPSRSVWRNSLYEHVVTNAAVSVSWGSGNAAVTLSPSTLDRLPVFHNLIPGPVDDRRAYLPIYPPLEYDTDAAEHTTVITYAVPSPDTPCLGAFIRLWTGGRYGTAYDNVLLTADTNVAAENRNAVFEVRYETNREGCTPVGTYGSWAEFGYNGANGTLIFIETTDNNSLTSTDENGLTTVTLWSRVVGSGGITGLKGCCIYATLHLVYAWNPGIAGSPMVDWTVPRDIPLLVSDSGETLTADIMTPNEDANYRHKAELVLLDENGDKVTESWGTTQIESGGFLASSIRSITASYSTSVFSHYPNTKTITGVIRLWTYWAQADVCCNANYVPVEDLFQIQLPLTSGYIPTNGSVSTAVIANGASITNKYIQGVSGVRVRMAAPTAKLGATIKRMVVSYYGGVAYVNTPDSSGRYPFYLNRLDVYGTVEFTVYVEDSRGLLSTPVRKSISVAQYHAPELATCDLYRADSNGTPNEYGEYGVISVTASASSVGGANSITGIYAAILPYSTTMNWSQATEVTLTSGQPQVFSGTLDPTVIYRVRLRITDTLGTETIRYRTLKTAAYTLHLKEGGQGIGLGQSAKEDKTVALADDWDLTLYGGQRLLDVLVPVGCVRMFHRNSDEAPVDPAELYPGTMWRRVSNRFLLAASAPDVADQKYPSGSTGGSETFEITAENIPELAVEHPYGAYAFSSGITGPVNTNPGFGGLTPARNGTGSGQWGGLDYLSGAYANKGNTAPQPVQHLPPYVAVDVWVRTA